MKKYIKETIVLFLQLFMFYVFPLFAGPTDAMAMVFLILCSTVLLGVVIGGVSKNGVKYLYPVAIAILFIPSVFIYYNESALVHAVWYLVTSSIGLLVGTVIRIIILKGKMR